MLKVKIELSSRVVVIKLVTKRVPKSKKQKHKRKVKAKSRLPANAGDLVYSYLKASEGWGYVTGNALVSFFYVKPGVKKVSGVMGDTMFAGPQALLEYIQANRPEVIESLFGKGKDHALEVVKKVKKERGGKKGRKKRRKVEVHEEETQESSSLEEDLTREDTGLFTSREKETTPTTPSPSTQPVSSRVEEEEAILPTTQEEDSPSSPLPSSNLDEVAPTPQHDHNLLTPPAAAIQKVAHKLDYLQEADLLKDTPVNQGLDKRKHTLKKPTMELSRAEAGGAIAMDDLALLPGSNSQDHEKKSFLSKSSPNSGLPETSGHMLAPTSLTSSPTPSTSFKAFQHTSNNSQLLAKFVFLITGFDKVSFRGAPSHVQVETWAKKSGASLCRSIKQAASLYPEKQLVTIARPCAFRTTKFIAAVMQSRGVCTHFQWLLDSISQDKPLDLQAYSLPVPLYSGIPGETRLLFEFMAPRLPRGVGPMSGVRVFLVGPEKTTKTWATVLKNAGASLVDTPDAGCVSMCCPEDLSEEAMHAASLASRHQSSLVSFNWVLQSIYYGRCLPVDFDPRFSISFCHSKLAHPGAVFDKPTSMLCPDDRLLKWVGPFDKQLNSYSALKVNSKRVELGDHVLYMLPGQTLNMFQQEGEEAPTPGFGIVKALVNQGDQRVMVLEGLTQTSSWVLKYTHANVQVLVERVLTKFVGVQDMAKGGLSCEEIDLRERIFSISK